VLALVSCRPSSALYTECPSRPVHELSLQFEKATDNVDVDVDAAGRLAAVFICGVCTVLMRLSRVLMIYQHNGMRA